MSTTSIQLLDIQQDQWLTDVMGLSVWRVVPIPDVWDAGSEALVDELQCHCQGQSRALYYAKVGVEQVPRLHDLNAAGMSVVDVNITLEIASRQVNEAMPNVVAGSNVVAWSPDHATRSTEGLQADLAMETCGPGGGTVGRPATTRTERTRVQVVECRPQDVERVLEIAATSFRFSRMHLDPLIPTQIANRVRNDWVQSYLHGERGDRLFVGLLNDKAVGFLAALVSHTDRQRIGVLDLMGVSIDAQRQGVGVALVQHWMSHYGPTCDVLRVGTQSANIPALRLYEKCGLQTASSAYVLHRHVG